MTMTMTDDQVATANYRGDHRGALGSEMGPTTGGEIMIVVAAFYDETTNRTKLGFAVSGHVSERRGFRPHSGVRRDVHILHDPA